MNDDSLLTLIFNASIPVQLVMLLLLGASVLSWALMYEKRGYIRQSQAEARDFEGRFWSGLNLSDLFSQLSQREERRFGLEAIFENGFREFARARKAELRNSESVRSAHRAMKVAMAREFEMLESTRSVRSAPMSGCLAPCGGSWNRFARLPACSRLPWRWWRPAFPRR